jgi:hypothetical protein
MSLKPSCSGDQAIRPRASPSAEQLGTIVKREINNNTLHTGSRGEHSVGLANGSDVNGHFFDYLLWLMLWVRPSPIRTAAIKLTLVALRLASQNASQNRTTTPADAAVG